MGSVWMFGLRLTKASEGGWLVVGLERVRCQGRLDLADNQKLGRNRVFSGINCGSILTSVSATRYCRLPLSSQPCPASCLLHPSRSTRSGCHSCLPIRLTRHWAFLYRLLFSLPQQYSLFRDYGQRGWPGSSGQARLPASYTPPATPSGACTNNCTS